MLYNISVMTPQGSYEFQVKGDEEFPQRLYDAYVNGKALAFKDIDGAQVVLSPLNLLGLIIKEADEEENDPPGD